jgi:hypothetical protein
LTRHGPRRAKRAGWRGFEGGVDMKLVSPETHRRNVDRLLAVARDIRVMWQIIAALGG